MTDETLKGGATDDEREALLSIFAEPVIASTDEEVREAFADMVLAAGFRRSEVPEPSAEMIAPEDGMTLEELGKAISNWSPEWDGDEAMHSLIYRFIEHYAALDAEVYAAREEHDFEPDAEILFRYNDETGTLVRVPAEPQGEPSDAQVEAAARALFEEPGHDPESPDFMSWDDVVAEDPSRADIWREDARRALRAASEVEG